MSRQEDFAHLFPTTDSDASDSSTAPASHFEIDYVIVFRFPTTGGDRQTLEKDASEAFQQLAGKLTGAKLEFRTVPGKSPGTLLVLVTCPSQRLGQAFHRERVRDFLLGVRIENPDGSSASIKRNDFTDAERLRLVYDMLTLPSLEGGAGISPGVDPCVESIMPLHNSKFNKEWIKSWSRKWRISQDDLTHIRDHLGEKMAFYFAFLQNYLLWLFPPAALGVFVHFSHSNTLSVWYSLAMLVWSVTFIEMWRRREKELAVLWGVRNCSRYEKRRADFKGDAIIRDEVTGEDMPYCPTWKVLLRHALSLPGVAFGAFLLSGIVALVFLLQLFLHEYYTGPFRQFLHYAPTLGYVLLIPTMSNVYSKWVRVLNNWEMHKTESSWENHYTQKIFIANFLVAYLSLFITGWIYIPFGDHVLPYLSEFNISHSHEKVDFQRLRAQLVYFVVTGQIVGFLTEMVVPYGLQLLMPRAKKVARKISRKDKKKQDSNETPGQNTPGEESALMKKVHREVEMDEYNIYTDYVEMVIQFGYVSMFSTVWPLTALCCLVNNWVELRGDAVKVCQYTRRPIPARAEGIGAWMGNMETLVWLSSITMASFAYLFHPSTNIHSHYTPVFTLLAILLSEHLYVAIKFAVTSVVQMLPSLATLSVRKEEYKLKQLCVDRLFPVECSAKVASDEADAASPTFGSQEYSGVQLIQDAFKTR